jgi:hypothetical protein
VEAIRLFDSTTTDFNVTIDQFMKVMFLLEYIQKWRLELWGLEFKVKVGSHKGRCGSFKLEERRH